MRDLGREGKGVFLRVLFFFFFGVNLEGEYVWPFLFTTPVHLPSPGDASGDEEGGFLVETLLFFTFFIYSLVPCTP